MSRIDIGKPIAGPVIVDTYIFFDKEELSDPHPIRKEFGDEDNLRKAICDGLVKQGFLVDDAIIVGGENYKVFDTESWSYIEIWTASQRTKNIKIS
jgi:Holliday junction resolvase RusA-like endonuclease